MKIRYVHAGLLDHPGRFVLQGCNARGKMNSGVAREIRDNYPRCFEIYEATHAARGLSMGQVVVADCGRFVFFNGITQNGYREYAEDMRLYADYDAIRMVMKVCDGLLKSEGKPAESWNDPLYSIHKERPPTLPELAMPLIGAGLANGDWRLIAPVIEAESANFQPVVYIKEKAQYDKIIAQGY